ncbi:unnamed protein product [Rhodiola kirilowii]
MCFFSCDENNLQSVLKKELSGRGMIVVDHQFFPRTSLSLNMPWQLACPLEARKQSTFTSLGLPLLSIPYFAVKKKEKKKLGSILTKLIWPGGEALTTWSC